MTVDQRIYALIQNLRALEAMKKAYEDRVKLLKETLKKLEEFGPQKKYYLSVFGVLLVEATYEEAKKQIEEEIATLEARIAKLEKQIEEIKAKVGVKA